MNVDKLKEELIKTQKSVCDNLTEEEEKEINIFIDHMIQNLQEKIGNIDYSKVASTISRYIVEQTEGDSNG